MSTPTLYIGLMSGTSADAIDISLVDLKQNTPKLVGTHSEAISAPLRAQIHQLSIPGHNEIDRMSELDQRLGSLFANAVNQLLKKYDMEPKHIAAIGSHGQTIRHRPPQTTPIPFTLQIGDPNVIAHQTGITTVADFRRRDMAAGGQGAPLVPAFHQAIFAHKSRDRVIVNIGGMANITWLPTYGSVCGFDTGPGNVLMDTWILKHLGKPYDANGDWAASGSIDNGLLNRLLSHPFFAQTAPKSTGREAFNMEWLASTTSRQEEPVNVQATLLALTARTIAQEIDKLTQRDCEVLVCGGGAYNTHLMHTLQTLLPKTTVSSTLSVGIAPEWIESMAFAWLAKQTMQRQTGNISAVTGASEEVILGGVYFA